MKAWRTGIVVSLGLGRGTADVFRIRQDGILICRRKGDREDHYFDLGTGLLHSFDPKGELDRNGYIQPVDYEVVGLAPHVLEQVVQALANPQVKADQLFQGLKASFDQFPTNTKFVRNYLGGVLLIQGDNQLPLAALINFIIQEFDKE